jgi:hypothetical protein
MKKSSKKTNLPEIKSGDFIYLANYKAGMTQRQLVDAICVRHGITYASNQSQVRKDVKKIYGFFQSDEKRQIFKNLYMFAKSQLFYDCLAIEIARSNDLFSDFMKDVFWTAGKRKESIDFWKNQHFFDKKFPEGTVLEKIEAFNQLISLASELEIVRGMSPYFLYRSGNRMALLYMVYTLKGDLDHADYALLGFNSKSELIYELKSLTGWNWWKINDDESINLLVKDVKGLIAELNQDKREFGAIYFA